jgi:hypothetical protein
MNEELAAIAAEQEHDLKQLDSSLKNLDAVMQKAADGLNEDFSAIDKGLIALGKELAEANDLFEKGGELPDA